MINTWGLVTSEVYYLESELRLIKPAAEALKVEVDSVGLMLSTSG